ncbi:hypothetical protein QQ045_005934 [Rhodiola kirilowii]
MESRARSKLLFAVNGQRFEFSSIDPSTTLLEFLRGHTRFKSVKLSCGEGGCGACVVLLSKYNSELNRVDEFTVSSCLTLLCSINGCSVTTTEGLGNKRDGFHAIHQRFAGFHASQCGFCTPGMCMSLFSALINAEKSDRPMPPPGFSKLTVPEAEKAIAGNLCRCTGYRPIVDACKSFACDVDIEDLGLNAFWKKEDSTKLKASKLPSYDPSREISTFPEFLKKESKVTTPFVMNSEKEKQSWYSPTSLEELQSLLNNEGVDEACSIKLVSGNTGSGYYKEVQKYDKYIDLSYIPQLSMIQRVDTGIILGTTVTISKAIEVLKDRNSRFREDDNVLFEKLANHMGKIASHFIRNSASIGGNLVMSQRNHFPSDLATILLGVDTIVNIAHGSRHESLKLEEFLERLPLDPKAILLSIKIPTWVPVNTSSSENRKVHFETYRASPRPLGNALPYLNASFLAEISTSEESKEALVHSCRLAFGAYGVKHAVRARKVEMLISGKLLTTDILYEALKLVKATVIPADGTSHGTYRSSLAVSFLFEFLGPIVNADIKSEITSSSICDEPCSDLLSDHTMIPTMISSGKQLLVLNQDYRPVGEPIMKSESAIQASGEAQYVDDIPSPPNCLHAAFVCSTKSLAHVNDIKLDPSTQSDEVTAVISYKDIPQSGTNAGYTIMFGTGPLFADGVTECVGQYIGLVVSETQKKADVAAKLAVVEYDIEGLEPPILTVEQAVERSSFFEVPSYLYPQPVGDFMKGMDEADQKIISAEIRLGSQYHFYMETQTALAVPEEDNCMVVYSSIQCPEIAHQTIARCLGLPEHNIRVITRRVGGGFGGKSMKATTVATACALAAHKLRRPVRIYNNRKTDMLIAGGRHPMKITYDVGFKNDGKVTALYLNILINAGMDTDISPVMPHGVVSVLKKYDWGAFYFDIKVCKTNLFSRTAMRAPGEVQGTYIAEAVIEKVASHLKMDVDIVRSKNVHTFESLNLFYKHSAGEPEELTLPSLWDKVAESSRYYQRAESIKLFNHTNKWRKRAISRVPVIYQASVRATPGKVSILSDGSISVEVGGIELGQGLWTKAKQMAAFGLSSIKCEGSTDLLDKVRVVQSDTLSLTQGGFTAGSTTSESSCAAVKLCCDILVERLLPLKERLEQQMSSVTWETLISVARLQSINLSSSCYFVPDFDSMNYLIYGAAVSEVEIDILTGQTTILQSDILYDCGKSLNPAVDLGQIEGAFVQGIGFFMYEEYLSPTDNTVIADGTWNYKIPTVDTIPKKFNVEILNSGNHKKRVLSSKASGEPPLLLSVSIHCATRAAVREARKQLASWHGIDEECATQFDLPVPATMPVVKELCGLDSVERYLQTLSTTPVS